MNAIPIRLLAAALLAGAGPALADTIYKYQRSDGTVVYSDAPVRGARLLERFDVAQAPAAPPRASSAPASADPGSAAPAEDRHARLEAADAEVRAAQQALDAAKARLDQGAEPLPGERSAIVAGGTRLNESYVARQQALQADVDRASARLDEAYRRRNDAR
jgi:uncharacterized protein DUF4124